MVHPAKVLLSVLLALAFVLPCPVQAATVYEDPEGRFAMDLPDGWALLPQTDPAVFVFEGKEKVQVILQHFPDQSDPAELFDQALATVKGGGVPDPAPEGDLVDLKVNGHPARWGVYSGAVAGMKVVLISPLGGVGLGEGGVDFVTFLNSGNRKKMEKVVQGMFESIRLPGEKASGVSGRTKTAAAAPAASASQAGTPFAHDLVTMEIAPGWEAQPMGRNFEKEVVGFYSSPRLAGGTMLLICYKGMGMNMVKSIKGIKQTVEAAIPNASPVAVKESEKTDSGREVTYITYQGTSAAQGQDIPMGAVTATVKGKKSYVNIVVIVAAHLIPAATEDVTRMAKSVQ